MIHKIHDSYVLTLVAEVSLKDESLFGTFHFGPSPYEKENDVNKEVRNEKVAPGKTVNSGIEGTPKKSSVSK